MVDEIKCDACQKVVSGKEKNGVCRRSFCMNRTKKKYQQNCFANTVTSLRLYYNQISTRQSSKAGSNKLNDIHSRHTGNSESQLESSSNPIREMKPNIFNLRSEFMDRQEESIKVQVHDSPQDELLKELGDQRKCVIKMKLQIEKLASRE